MFLFLWIVLNTFFLALIISAWLSSFSEKKNAMPYGPRGPQWLYNLAAILSLVGAICVLAGIVYGIYYLITHLQWVA